MISKDIIKSARKKSDGFEKRKGRDWLENSAATNTQQPQAKATLDGRIVSNSLPLRIVRL